MQKLMLSAAIALAITGCNKKQDKPAPVATGSASADVPPECNEYKAAIEKLATCDKLPQQARDQLNAAYEQTSKGWANLPAAAKPNLASGCKAGTDAVIAAAHQACGW